MTPMDPRQQHLLVTAFLRALQFLDSRELYVLERRILAENPDTQGEVGCFLEVSASRAQQLEAQVRRKLAHALNLSSAGAAAAQPGIRSMWVDPRFCDHRIEPRKYPDGKTHRVCTRCFSHEDQVAQLLARDASR